MIKKVIIELSNPICKCPEGTLHYLDLDHSKNKSYEFCITCTGCNTYLSTPLGKLSAVVLLPKEEPVKEHPIVKKVTKLTLIQNVDKDHPH
jgi:hypothetical protein